MKVIQVISFSFIYFRQVSVIWIRSEITSESDFQIGINLFLSEEYIAF